MATVRAKPQFLSPSKSFFKLAVIVAFVIFIIGKLVNDGILSQNKDSSVENSVDEMAQEVPHSISKTKQAKLTDLTKNNDYNVWDFEDTQADNEIYVMIPLAKVKSNPRLQMKFQTCVSSISETTSADVVVFVVGDEEGHDVADRIVKTLPKGNILLQLVNLDALGEEMKNVITTMQKHFSYQPGSYYSHTLFFLSVAIHRLAPEGISRLIMLDADLKFQTDIKLLHDHFSRFSASNVIGLAYENQPVYRHILSTYRQSHPGTRAGDPPPHGLPGFNSGVLLLDMEKMRKSERYNSLLDSDIVNSLAEKYSYKGHLGDQDFYSLVSLENEDLFYVLPCTWNRQLCQWWRDKGYETVFDSYFVCNGSINVYHGNCDTPFPEK